MPSLFTAVRDIRRLRQIYVVLVRHGFADVAQRLGLRGSKPTEDRDEQEVTSGEAGTSSEAALVSCLFFIRCSYRW